MNNWRINLHSWFRRRGFGTYPTNDKVGTSLNKLTEETHYIDVNTGEETFLQDMWFIVFDNPKLGISIKCNSKYNYEEDNLETWNGKDRSRSFHLTYEELDKLYELSQEVRFQYQQLRDRYK